MSGSDLFTGTLDLLILRTLSAGPLHGDAIGRKIRDTELKKVPLMLIIGEKEKAEGKVSVRRQGEGDKGSMSLEEFVSYFNTLI